MKQLIALWMNLSLARQFVLASFIILLIGMASVSAWVSHKIEMAVVHNSSVSTALYMDSFVAPLIQELDQARELSDETRLALDDLIANTPLGERVLSFKIWLENGYVAYSSRSSIAGKTFPVTDNLADGWKGRVHADFDDLEDDEDALERAAGLPLLEIYSPVRSRATGKIIAVSEFYSIARELKSDLFRAKMQSRLLFAGVGTLMFLALSSIAFRGSRTIESQKRKLEERVHDLSELRRRVETASRKTTELNEHYLRRIGSDLHDGPSQLIALALLKMDSLKQRASELMDPSDVHEIEVTRDSLNESLKEIRDITAGLAMPEIEGLSVEQTLQKAVKSHVRRTGMSVDIDGEDHRETYPHSILICLYRFVQETLSNAYQHGQATDATIRISCDDNTLQVKVSDSGSGFDVGKVAQASTGFGLPGLRERIESVGGFFDIQSRPNHGTQATVRFVIASSED